MWHTVAMIALYAILLLMMIDPTYHQPMYVIDCPYIQRTGCVSVYEGDVIYCKIHVSTNEKLDSLENVKFEHYKENEYNDLVCYVPLDDCRGYSLANCYCQNSSNQEKPQTFDIILNFSALYKHSGAQLRGTMTYLDQIFVSEWTIPEIIENNVIEIKDSKEKCTCETDSGCKSEEELTLYFWLFICFCALFCIQNIVLIGRYLMKKYRSEDYARSQTLGTTVDIQSEPKSENLPKDDDHHQAPAQNQSTIGISYAEFLAKGRIPSNENVDESVIGHQLHIKNNPLGIEIKQSIKPTIVLQGSDEDTTSV